MDDEQQVEVLCERVREHRRRFDAAEPGRPEYQSALADVLHATKELVDFEEGIPGRRDRAARSGTASIVRRCGLAVFVISLGISALALPHMIDMWWLIFLLPMAAVGAWMALTRGEGKAPDDIVRRSRAYGMAGATAAGGAGVLLSMVMVNWFVGGLVLAGTAVAVRCGIDLYRRHPAAPSAGGLDASYG
ncbi:hypothetical protein [Labedaea rhizosphaerae]|uniref:Uncharacterized protein n=1 Tax=Labedaea rhizosphaerae TaxID=598644 RepID=A0A4R6SKH9_LABRH|nr:hypothetical protein [Labedaea rhizosphaerae]TDQ04896.1 hypothetical protein EV186_101857 [Labedaea rhizosphaerae]